MLEGDEGVERMLLLALRGDFMSWLDTGGGLVEKVCACSAAGHEAIGPVFDGDDKDDDVNVRGVERALQKARAWRQRRRRQRQQQKKKILENGQAHHLQKNHTGASRTLKGQGRKRQKGTQRRGETLRKGDEGIWRRQWTKRHRLGREAGGSS
ncbi:hypothetical protein I7I51_04887 [Histoplasma capsulatum]|uniref:Uncharacterized protein n=1 Tax=Ajellomyces capsulatus TaxID=5037 RepID=A0A8A1M264_AJECA|nr:hypothetical protein I7I51_04887 [Histoplasma capsulatum]